MPNIQDRKFSVGLRDLRCFETQDTPNLTLSLRIEPVGLNHKSAGQAKRLSGFIRITILQPVRLTHNRPCLHDNRLQVHWTFRRKRRPRSEDDMRPHFQRSILLLTPFPGRCPRLLWIAPSARKDNCISILQHRH